MPTYRKTKDGRWVVFGSAATVTAGLVTVTRKDGTTKQETVVSVSKPFDVDGVPHVYGTIATRARPGGCQCTEQGCCRPRCFCTRECACKGGPIYDCMG